MKKSKNPGSTTGSTGKSLETKELSERELDQVAGGHGSTVIGGGKEAHNPIDIVGSGSMVNLYKELESGGKKHG